MGCFSWMFADRGNQESLRIGSRGYVACPDGRYIETRSYGGYGRFSGQDVYNLVVDWNRAKLKEILADREFHPSICEKPFFVTEKFVDSLMESDKKAQEYIDDCINPDSYLRTDWKREFGIYLACYDEDNESLPFPIKITKTTDYCYEELPASEGDPDQGFERKGGQYREKVQQSGEPVPCEGREVHNRTES